MPCCGVIELLSDVYKVGGIQLAILVGIIWVVTLFHASARRLIEAWATRISLPPPKPKDDE